MNSLSILRRPIITEKSTLLQDQGKYAFEVSDNANKFQIKVAVQEAFDVDVVKVNVIKVRGKRKRFGPRETSRKSWKKAIVSLAPGQTITIFEGV